MCDVCSLTVSVYRAVPVVTTFLQLTTQVWGNIDILVEATSAFSSQCRHCLIEHEPIESRDIQVKDFQQTIVIQSGT